MTCLRVVQHSVALTKRDEGPPLRHHHGGSIITCASFFLGGEYLKGVWPKAIFCFCKNKEKTSSSDVRALAHLPLRTHFGRGHTCGPARARASRGSLTLR